MTVHILKLCVGIDSIEHLIDVRKGRAHHLPDGTSYNYHVTRFRPKRAEEILDGGSIYWIIKGFIQLRQKIIGLESIKIDDVTKCKIIMDSTIVRTESQPRRPHQGWRYLAPADAPKDIAKGVKADDIPLELSRELRKMGLI
ncbi:hypothetical protein MNBD_ALPHA03-688 [hydrothermal vent metagenome]|uniref:Uncharacterized protein n=1 Tax=hydrothermal vent metagenome TaxID=652676 RepID=A0A3B1AF41_9ZZZZ